MNNSKLRRLLFHFIISFFILPTKAAVVSHVSSRSGRSQGVMRPDGYFCWCHVPDVRRLASPGWEESLKEESEGRVWRESLKEESEGRVWRESLKEESEGRVWRKSLKEESEGRVWRKSLKRESEGRVWRKSLKEESEERVWRESLKEESEGRVWRGESRDADTTNSKETGFYSGSGSWST